MEFVDIGMASTHVENKFDWQTNKSECGNNDFHRPIYSYVSPEGNVKTLNLYQLIIKFGQPARIIFG